MSQRQLKTGYFILEGLNSFSTVFYTNYLYFFMHEAFGFENKANLLLAATNGVIYMIGSFWAGRLAQRFGYFTALKIGFSVSVVALLAGTQMTSAAGHVAVLALVVLGMCCVWPTVEALVSHGESADGVQRMVGLYNIVWSGTGALAYFTGGAMLQHWGLRSLFFVPAIIQLGQLLFIIWLSRKAPDPAIQNVSTGIGSSGSVNISQSHPSSSHPNRRINRTFRMLAWLANPLAYLAINTLIAVIPGVAKKFGLSTSAAGFCCSVWFFVRFASFWLLWHWPGWHYRFRWLLAAYAALAISFTTILAAPHLAALVIAQLIFGVAVGLIYYSSLYYAMDGTEDHGEHGGIHEAAIGLGNFAGPAIGAVSLHFFPEYSNSATIAVSTVLFFGLGGLVAIWWKGG